MARQVVIYAVVVLVGLAGGTGIGYWAAQSKIGEANATIEQLQADQSQAQDELKAVDAEIAKLKGDLSRTQNAAVRLNTELTRTKKELGRNQAVLKQALNQQQPATGPAVTPTPQTSAATTVSKPAVPLPAGVREYTIKDGDSLWKIAANELGSGVRLEEILKLNPQITKSTTLTIGTKIKIPAK